MSQNTASKGSEISKDQLTTQATAPLLSPDKEAILKELTYIDIHGDRKAESESDKKMLAWTLNEIRKTCSKLPANKLSLLVESIKRVMIEKTVYQSTIENELKKQRDILKKELDNEQKAKPTPPPKEGLGASVVSFFQRNTDIRLFTKNKLENIGNMSPKEQTEFIRTIEQDDDTMAKFMQGFQNDVRWRQNLRSENKKSHDMLSDVYATLAKKYKINISPRDTLGTVKDTIISAKKEYKEGAFNSEKAKILANSISQDFLSPLDMEIQQIITGNTGSNYSKLSTAITVYNISQLYTKAGDTAIKIRKSKQYQELLLLAETSKDKEIIKKFEIFREKLAELDALSKEYDSVAETGTLINQERTLNVLTRLKSKIGAMNQGIQKGDRLLEFYNKDEGN
ncbi:MAG: hypothetical protein PHU93_01335, partial [Candidatus Gracilibacteria bacterium]|nr:hypothetical protein [Candidatus Gracilibacteria bacterium]